MTLLASTRTSSWTAGLFVLLAVFWGTSFVAIEVGLHYFPTVLFAALRYAVAGLLVLGYATRTTDDWLPRSRDDWLVTAVAAVFIIAGYHGLLYLGEEFVSGAIAAVVISLSPVLTAVFASLLLAEESLEPADFGGLLLGLLGVVIVADPNPDAMFSASFVGIALVFLGGASFALGSVLTRPFDADLPLAAMEGWAMVLGSGLLFAVGALRGESLAAIQWTPVGVASLGYLTLVSGVVAFLLYFELLDRVGATKINLVGYLEPVVATVVSWLLLGDLVGTSAITGFAAIFVGFAVVKRRALYDTVAGPLPADGT